VIILWIMMILRPAKGVVDRPVTVVRFVRLADEGIVDGCGREPPDGWLIAALRA
jgi:hypothetical protein